MYQIRVQLVTVCCLVLLACSGKTKPEAAGGEAEPAATQVEVAAVKRQAISHVITAEAILYPIATANIMPKISAPVQRFLVNRGDHVKKGQLVAVLEAGDLAAAAQESKGLYEQAQSTYKISTEGTLPEDTTKARTDVQSARQALDAANKLLENRQALYREGALAQKLVDDAKVSQVQAQSLFDTASRHLESFQTVSRGEQLKSSKAQVDTAKAHYEGAAAQLGYAEVRSPIQGVVSDRPLNPGEIASSSSALISLVDISQVVARANVPVQDAASIHVGKTATITGPGGELTGKVTVVSPAVDPNTTTVEVWVQAVNSKEVLKPGITVQIAVNAEELPDAMVVPSSAILSLDEGGDKVMVVGADSVAHERKIETGVRQGDLVQIVNGVKEGEQVITSGGLGLDDKAKVEVQKAGEKEGGDKGAADEKTGGDEKK